VGVIIARNELVYDVVPMIDSAGHPQRQRFVKRLHHHWLEPADLDESRIREDWIQ
jgi:hypothetical protein